MPKTHTHTHIYMYMHMFKKWPNIAFWYIWWVVAEIYQCTPHTGILIKRAVAAN